MTCVFICDNCGTKAQASPQYIASQPPLHWTVLLTYKGVKHACSVACATAIPDVRPSGKASKRIGAERESDEEGWRGLD